MKVMWHIVAWPQKTAYKFGQSFRIVQEKNGHTQEQVLN